VAQILKGFVNLRNVVIMSGREIMVGDKPLSSLRVVDLKAELEKRGLSKSGTKKDLVDRLKAVSQINPFID